MRRRGASAGTLLLFGAIALVAAVAVGFLLLRPPSAGAWELRTEDFHALLFSPTDPNTVYFGHHNGIMISTDGGRTWTDLHRRQGFDAMAMAVHPREPNVLYMAGHNVFYVSRNGGRSWEPMVTDLPGTDIHGFAVSRGRPGVLFAFVVGHGLFVSEDRGSHWSLLSRALPTDITSIASAGGTPEVLYVASASEGVLMSIDGGASWQSAAAPGWQWRSAVISLAVSPADPSVLLAGTADGLYRSGDGGRTWQRLSYPGSNAVALAIAPDGRRVLAVEFVKQGLGRVHISDDGGDTWDKRP